MTLTSNLRFVTTNFMTVRLADGRVIDARLPQDWTLAASAITGQYKLGDLRENQLHGNDQSVICPPLSRLLSVRRRARR